MGEDYTLENPILRHEAYAHDISESYLEFDEI